MKRKIFRIWLKLNRPVSSSAGLFVVSSVLYFFVAFVVAMNLRGLPAGDPQQIATLFAGLSPIPTLFVITGISISIATISKPLSRGNSVASGNDHWSLVALVVALIAVGSGWQFGLPLLVDGPSQNSLFVLVPLAMAFVNCHILFPVFDALNRKPSSAQLKVQLQTVQKHISQLTKLSWRFFGKENTGGSEIWRLTRLTALVVVSIGIVAGLVTMLVFGRTTPMQLLGGMCLATIGGAFAVVCAALYYCARYSFPGKDQRIMVAGAWFIWFAVSFSFVTLIGTTPWPVFIAFAGTYTVIGGFFALTMARNKNRGGWKLPVRGQFPTLLRQMAALANNRSLKAARRVAKKTERRLQNSTS